MLRFMSLLCALFVGVVLLAPAQESAGKSAGGKVTVLISHEVKDYAAWRKVFDADMLNREKGGFHVTGVYADAKNLNLVTVMGEFPSAATVDAFIKNPKLKEAMEKGGVMGRPDVKVLVPKGK
jgi:hypothetical protein